MYWRSDKHGVYRRSHTGDQTSITCIAGPIQYTPLHINLHNHVFWSITVHNCYVDMYLYENRFSTTQYSRLFWYISSRDKSFCMDELNTWLQGRYIEIVHIICHIRIQEHIQGYYKSFIVAITCFCLEFHY